MASTPLAKPPMNTPEEKNRIPNPDDGAVKPEDSAIKPDDGAVKPDDGAVELTEGTGEVSLEVSEENRYAGSRRPSVHVHDPTTILLKPVKRIQPSLEHKGLRVLMFFPGWDSEMPFILENELEQSRCFKDLTTDMQLGAQSITPFVAQSLISPGSHLVSPSSLPTVFSPGKSDIMRGASPEGHITDEEEAESVVEDWKDENVILGKLLQIPFFTSFQLLKPFHVWRAKVHEKRLQITRSFLQDTLFFIRPFFSSALIEISEMCSRIKAKGLCYLDRTISYTLQNFLAAQDKHLKTILVDFANFQEQMTEVVLNACRESLAAYLPTQVDKDLDIAAQKGILAKKEVQYLCQIIPFFRLVDYVVAYRLHDMVEDAVVKLLNAFKEQLDVAGGSSIPPVFSSELSVSMDGLYYDPSAQDFQEAVAKTISDYEDTVLSVNRLMSGTELEALSTSSDFLAAKAQYERCPCLKSLLDNDTNLQGIKRRIKDLIQWAFDSAEAHKHEYNYFLRIYRENESLDLEALWQNDGLDFFEKNLDLYNRQHEKTLAIPERTNLDSLYVEKRRFKETIGASVIRCLDVVNDILVQGSKKKVDTILDQVEQAKVRLQVQPTTTKESADSHTMLEEITDLSLLVEEEQFIVSEMYRLIDKYLVPTPPEDLQVFSKLQVIINSLHSMFNDRVLDMHENMEQFVSILKEDIKNLRAAITQIHPMSQNPDFLDIDVAMSGARPNLGEILSRIENLQTISHNYILYQKIFKMEVVTFDSLEELTDEFRLKKLLWDCLEEWGTIHENAWKRTLKQLNLEELFAEAAKFTEYVKRLEDLPPNALVSTLKTKVEVMKERLVVLTDLNNPCMKPDHWKNLELKVGAALNPEELSVSVWETLGVFNYGPEIHEVSDQATGEAELEVIITKVEDIWRTTVFTVLSDTDSMGSFTLGNSDEIQELLSESIISLNAVAMSVYVTAFRYKVEKMQKQMSVFTATLAEMLLCQEKWQNLFIKFAIPDMRKQLPAEYQMFLQVDKSWKEIVLRAKKLPNALTAGTEPGLQEVLKNNNGVLDEVEKSLRRKKLSVEQT